MKKPTKDSELLIWAFKRLQPHLKESDNRRMLELSALIVRTKDSEERWESMPKTHQGTLLPGSDIEPSGPAKRWDDVYLGKDSEEKS